MHVTIELIMQTVKCIWLFMERIVVPVCVWHHVVMMSSLVVYVDHVMVVDMMHV